MANTGCGDAAAVKSANPCMGDVLIPCRVSDRLNMNKTDNSTVNANPPPKRAAKVPSKETSLSLFESGLSYMLEAGWHITAEKARDANGVMVTTFRVLGADYVIADGEISLFEDVPVLVSAAQPDVPIMPTA